MNNDVELQRCRCNFFYEISAKFKCVSRNQIPIEKADDKGDNFDA